MTSNLETAWAKPIDEVAKAMRANLETGLASAEAARRLAEDGPNQIERAKNRSRLRLWVSQFESPVVLTLFAAAAIAAYLGEWVDATAILAILMLNAVIGFMQQLRAENAVEALRQLSAPRARVLRGGSIVEIPSSEVVRGDLLAIEAGDFIPADSRVTAAHSMTVAEAVLTGESIPVEKSPRQVAADSVLGDRSSMVFAGTAVAAGSGRAVVVSTAMHTEMGRIARMLTESRDEQTPLQIRLAQVSNRLLVAAAGIILVIFALGLARGGEWLPVALSSLSLAVAAIPEGLPAVVTLALALAVRRMARRNAIVRQLTAVETLGSTDVICTDKTGTLTTGVMRVREVVVEGAVLDSGSLNPEHPPAAALLEAGMRCNNGDVGEDGRPVGDPTETALLMIARECAPALWQARKQTRSAEWPFDSIRKRMSVAGPLLPETTVWVKGAPESVLPRCVNVDAEAVLHNVHALSQKGRRVLAVARRKIAGDDVRRGLSADEVETGLEFLGLFALADPPRAEATRAIAACREAGIQIVMITGDHPETARAIAKELGILAEGESREVLTGSDLKHIDAEELYRRVPNVAVFARVSPEDKISIVRAWERHGKIVAMTGDGVNDAPALKEASIGVAMGRGGTEVARQASAMILADDNFATIVAAVEEGRAVHENIKRTIQYLLAGNVGEILVMLLAALFGFPVPLLPVHLLWINLVTDGPPMLALAAEPVPKQALRETGKPSLHSFSEPRMYLRISVTGLIIGSLTFLVFLDALGRHGAAEARTAAFTFLVAEELFRSFTARSSRHTALGMGLHTNPMHLLAVLVTGALQVTIFVWAPLREVFSLSLNAANELPWIIALGLVPVTMLEITKLIRNRPHKG